MRFGVCGPVSLLETAKRTGFDYLEMQVTAVASWSEEEFEANCKKIQEVGLECRCFNVLFPGDIALIGDQADASRRDLSGVFCRGFYADYRSDLHLRAFTAARAQ